MTQLIDPPATSPAQSNGGQLARREFQPLAPIGTAGGLKSLLESQRQSIAMMLPKHITPERLTKTLLVAVNRNPDILKCTQSSILETVNRAAELGLDLSGTLGEAYPVPFNNNVGTRDKPQWAKQLTLIIGYRGLEKLAWQSGEVESIDAEVVREFDRFVFKKGTEVLVEWSPKIGGDRGAILGAYACVKMKSGGKLARFLPREDIEKIRNKAQSKNSPAWNDWWDEMARKCALKRTLKDAPLSTEKFVKAMEHDEADYGLADVLEAQTGPRDGTDRHNRALAARVSNRPVSEGQTLDTSTAHEDPGEAAGVNTAGEPTPGADESRPAAPSEPDVAGADAEAPPVNEVDEALAQDVSGYRRVLIDALVNSGAVSQAEGAKAVDGWIKLSAPKGDPNGIHVDRRRELYDSIKDGRAYVKEGRMHFRAKV